MIYLDYMSTTPVDPRVTQKMLHYLDAKENYGNAASQTHPYGTRAAEAVEKSRQQVAALICADPAEIIWTSGATEANNLAIKGAAFFYQRKGRHLVTLATEHKSVLDVFHYLESKGFSVTYLRPKSDGLVDFDQLKAALRDDTVLLSVMHVNNEIGVIQDIATIGRLARERGIILHVDAAQSAGRVPIDLQQWPVDLLSLSAHKVYGPKGIGALYVRRQPRVRLEPLIHGGGHEMGLRSGTLPTHQIVGMGEAFHIAQQEMHEENQRLLELRNYFWRELQTIPEVYLNGDLEKRVAGNLNVSFGHVEGEALRVSLHQLALSSGAACTSASLEPSHVLVALGRDAVLANSSLRFSFGRFTTREEIDSSIAQIKDTLNKLRRMSPLWVE